MKLASSVGYQTLCESAAKSSIVHTDSKGDCGVTIQYRRAAKGCFGQPQRHSWYDARQICGISAFWNAASFSMIHMDGRTVHSGWLGCVNSKQKVVSSVVG